MSDPTSSDLAGVAPMPTGPTEQTVILPPTNEDAPSIVGAPTVAEPPVVAASGETVLALEGPWFVSRFASGVVGAPVVTRSGTPVPASLADQIISVGATNGVVIVKR